MTVQLLQISISIFLHFDNKIINPVMRVTVSLVEFRALPSPIKEAAVSVQEETEKWGVMDDIWIYNSTQPDLFQSPETATSYVSQAEVAVVNVTQNC